MFEDDFADNGFVDDEEFEGGVFSKEIDGGRAGAFVRVGDRGISARTQDNREFFISFSDCQLDMGGASGRMVFCRTKDKSLTIFCEDKRFPDVLRREAVELYEEVDKVIHINRQRKWNERAGTWLALAIGVLILVGGYIGLMYGARAAVAAVPFEVDQQIGQAVLPSVISEFGEEIDDKEVIEPLQSIVDRLQPHAPLKEATFDVHVIDTPDVNAVALPGGPILIFRGLIDTCENGEQLASVIAHEMSHVTQRHHLNQVGRSIGIIAAIQIILGDVGGLAAIAEEMLTGAALNSYSQEQETEADLVGARMMHDAGLDPKHMADMLQSLPDLDLPAALNWLSTHPDSDARAERVIELLAELPAREYSGLDFDLEGLRQKLQQHDGAPPDDPE